METFTKDNLSVDSCASRLQPGNDAYDNIADSLEEIIDLFNFKGGWTVYAWGKRGLINDVSILGNDTIEPGDNNIISQDI